MWLCLATQNCTMFENKQGALRLYKEACMALGSTTNPPQTNPGGTHGSVFLESRSGDLGLVSMPIRNGQHKQVGFQYVYLNIYTLLKLKPLYCSNAYLSFFLQVKNKLHFGLQRLCIYYCAWSRHEQYLRSKNDTFRKTTCHCHRVTPGKTFPRRVSHIEQQLFDKLHEGMRNTSCHFY